MEQNSLFRKQSLERISSPEQLNDYLRVTGPSVWIIMAAVILLLVGMLVWASSARINSFVIGIATVRDGTMTVTFEDEQLAQNVEAGMSVSVGENSSIIQSIGRAEDGKLFATAPTSLSDGSFEARVNFRQTQVLRLLFN